MVGIFDQNREHTALVEGCALKRVLVPLTRVLVLELPRSQNDRAMVQVLGGALKNGNPRTW